MIIHYRLTYLSNRVIVVKVAFASHDSDNFTGRRLQNILEATPMPWTYTNFIIAQS